MATSNGSMDLKTGTPNSDQILLEPYNYLLQVAGKEIRAYLAMAFNYWLKIPNDKLTVIIEATQMMHNSSLLLDDIEDNSDLRRGIPVAHYVYGIPHTINTANYVSCLGLQKFQSLGHPDITRVFTEQLLELHRGQGMDIYWRDAKICPTEEEYKEMVIRKTGGLFGLAVRVMQLFSENQSDLKPLLDNLGLYFQIRDDYANLNSKELEATKGYAEDLSEGKFSFPIVHSLGRLKNQPEDNPIMSILAQKPTHNDVKKSCIEYLESTGTFEYTRKVLRELEESIRKQIEDLGGNPHLLKLIDKLCQMY